MLRKMHRKSEQVQQTQLGRIGEDLEIGTNDVNGSTDEFHEDHAGQSVGDI